MRCLTLVLVVACGACSGDAMPDAGPSARLTVMRLGGALGFVGSDPPGIVCGATCSASFPVGTTVSLFTTVAKDGTFTGWGGACFGTEACTVVIDGDQTVSATFPCTGRKAFNYPSAVQTFDTPACASRVIVEAWGAQGGNAGGLGARIRGAFATSMLASRALVVLVGEVGAPADVTESDATGGVEGSGGGGSFVYINANDPLPLVAAGGGGGNSSGCSGGPGSATDIPTMASGGTGNGTSGSNGGGGAGGANIGGSTSPAGTGGGGAGWLSDGRPGSFGASGGGGRAPRNGGSGGNAGINFDGIGGFGGGGGAAGFGGASGGGGGFNGGGGGNNLRGDARGCAGGGGSYNGGEDPMNVAGARVGQGRVTITWTE